MRKAKLKKVLIDILTPESNSIYEHYPLIENPVAEIKAEINNVIEQFSGKKKIKPTPISKCGLGKTQGIKGIFRGIQCDSLWEAAWYLYQTEIKGNVVFRNNRESFPYTDENGKKARFFPDFKMNGQYHEVKGIFRANDALKRDATIGLVMFWGANEMKKILTIVNKHSPNWKDEYVQTGTNTKLYGKKGH